MIERIERALSAMEREQCPACDGEGFFIEEDHDEDGYRAWQVGCEECAGKGWVIREPCIACGAPVNIDRPAVEQEHDKGCPVVEEVR